MSDAHSDFASAIQSTLGYGPHPEDVVPGKMIRFPTSERRSDDAGWCRLFLDERGGVFGDHRTGISTTWFMNANRSATRAEPTRDAQTIRDARQAWYAQQRAEQARNATYNDRLWSEAQRVKRGDPVALYLASRGIDLWPLPECIRVHHGLPYFDNGQSIGVFKVMVAEVIGADGRRVALHRTFITDDGRKAPVTIPKKLTSTSGPIAGGAIPLGRLTGGIIGIAEGIETALAAGRASGIPVVAAYCAGNLAAWRWPACTRRIVVFCDNDQAGRAAAETLRLRVRASNIVCDVLFPSTPGADWCDAWAARDAARTRVIT